MSRENYYILLELPTSPPETDMNRINAAIDRKQAEWSKLRSHPTKGRQAQRYLELLPDMKLFMADSDQRREEATQAEIIKKKEESDRYKELDAAIKLLSSKKQITEEEVNNLCKRFSFPEDVVRKRIKVPIVKGKKKKSAAKRLEPSEEKKISDSLDMIDKKSIYDFLALSPTSSTNTLLAKVKQVILELKRDSRKDAENTARQELTGFCLKVFKTEETRKMYDASLAYQRLTDLNKAIEIAGLDKRIDVEEFDSLMTIARQSGLRLDEAEEHITEYCTRKKWVVRTPTKPTVEKMQQCGLCGLMNMPGSKNCADCGTPLAVDCPECNHSNPSTHANCGQGGFPVGDMLNAIPLITAARKRKNGGNNKETAALLREALSFWPRHPEALPLLEEIEKKEKEISNLNRELNNLVSEQKFYKAHQVLFNLKQLDGKHPSLSLAAKIQPKINAAESWIKKARIAAKGDDAMDCFTRAILECKDCREAIDNMAKYPPDPPGSLKAVPSPRSISLQWNKSSSRGAVSYRIVRKSQSTPLNALDGESLGETSQVIFADSEAMPGEIYYYGIYSRRGEVFSETGVIAGPLIRTAEIENLSIIPGDSVINLTWKSPANIKGILVRVKSGSVPMGRNDGQNLRGTREDGVLAGGLTNGQLYGFFISAIFKNEKGLDVYSPGITCQSRPVSPPPPVKDMTVTKKENKINVNWTPPGKGTVQILYSKHPFPFSPGEAIPTSKLTGTGAQVPVRNAGSVQITVNFQGVIHILPVTIDGDIATAGKPGVATSIDEVANLKGSINSGKLYMEWDWPAGAQKVLIMYNNRAFPTRPDEENAAKKTFTRVEYLKHSGFVLRSIEEKDYYFTIFVAAGEGRSVIFSAGKQCLITNTGHVELYYDIHLNKSLLGKVKSAQLRVYTKGKKIKIPRTVLVKKLNNLPLRKTDGIQILSAAAVDVSEIPAAIDIPDREIHKAAYVKLFFEDDAYHQRFRIMPPSKDKLRLR